MRKMIDVSAHPAVAIGGIDAVRLPDVLSFGARNFAVVRAVCQNTDPYSAILQLKEAASWNARQSVI
jgi:thiamine monophosphate synthase